MEVGVAMIFAIEGPCYVGKTTLVKNLSYLDKYIKIIPEYEYFAKDSKLFGSQPQSRQQALKTVNFLLEIESARQKLILSFLKRKFIPVQDRSLFTCIAFDYAMSKIGGPNIWRKTQDLFLSKGFLLPNFIFFLWVNHEVLLKRYRNDKCSPLSNCLMDKAFNRAFKDYFYTIEHAIVFWINGELHPAKVLRDVYGLIKSTINPTISKREL